jgi:hypothetical protein
MSDGAGSGPPLGKTLRVKSPRQIPSPDSRRPPEPLRPLPATRAGITLLSAKARRRRYRRTESGGPGYGA